MKVIKNNDFLATIPPTHIQSLKHNSIYKYSDKKDLKDFCHRNEKLLHPLKSSFYYFFNLLLLNNNRMFYIRNTQKKSITCVYNSYNKGLTVRIMR